MLWIAKSLFLLPAAKKNPVFTKLKLEFLEGRTVPALAPTPIDTWFNQNMGQNPQLCQQAQSLFNSGHDLNYSDMISLFRFTAAQQSTIGAYDLGALRRLVAYSVQAGWMPDYVANLSQKVLNYNPSNFYFQFQISSTTNAAIAPNLLPKGVLQAGQPSTLINTLVQKWFLGKDHPDMANVRLSNTHRENGVLKSWAPLGNAQNSAYKLASGILWANNGPEFEDIDQGYAGDCYFLSSLGSTVATNALAIKDMFINNGNGTYTIRFYKPNEIGTRYTASYVTVDKFLPFQYLQSSSTSVGTYPAGWYFQFANGGPEPVGPNAGDYGAFTNLNTGPASLSAPNTYPYATNVLWVSLLEKAYAQFNAEISVEQRPSGKAQGSLPVGANSYYVIGEGGFAANDFNGANTRIATFGALSEINGRQSSFYDLPDYQRGTATANTIINLLNAGQAVTIASRDTISGKSGNEVVTGHVYFITAYDATTGLFTLRNPWGYLNTSQGKAGMLSLPFSGTSPSLTADFQYVCASLVPRIHRVDSV